VHADASAEALSITRLEGSRWRGGRLWSRELGSEDVGESEPRHSLAWIDAGRSVSLGDHDAHEDEDGRDTRKTDRPLPWRVGTHLSHDEAGSGTGPHDVSKMKDTRASWYALRMGPTIIGAPQRGQDHAGVAGNAFAGAERCLSNRRASVSRAVRQ
jgi:hypothetical protein